MKFVFRTNIVRDARVKSGLSAADLAKALGYRIATSHGMRQQVYDMEQGRKPITPMVQRLCVMFVRYGVPDDFLNDAEQLETAHQDDLSVIRTRCRKAEAQLAEKDNENKQLREAIKWFWRIFGKSLPASLRLPVIVLTVIGPPPRSDRPASAG
jgi:transcriptional regulator with XRE-family HTH domain